MSATDNIAQCAKTRGISATVIFNSVICQELNVRVQDSKTTGPKSDVMALKRAASETTMLRGSIATIERQNAANVNGPKRGSRMAVADIDTVAVVNRIGSNRGVGG